MLSTPSLATLVMVPSVPLPPVHTLSRYPSARSAALKLIVMLLSVLLVPVTVGVPGSSIVSLATALPALHAFSPGAFSHAL